MNIFSLIRLSLMLILNLNGIEQGDITYQSIKNLLQKIYTSEQINTNDLNNLITLMKTNEKINCPSLFFPHSENDTELLWKVIDKILVMSYTDTSCISTLIKLDEITKRNIELGEYLTEIQHKIALNNTLGFVQVYQKLSKCQKESVIYALGWLEEIKKISEFFAKLDKINNETLSQTIQNLKTAMQK